MSEDPGRVIKRDLLLELVRVLRNELENGELSQAKSDISKLTAAIGEAEANRRYFTEEARFEEVQLAAVYMFEDLGQKLCIRRLKTGQNHLNLGVWTPGGSNWLGSPITVDGVKLLEALQALFG